MEGLLLCKDADSACLKMDPITYGVACQVLYGPRVEVGHCEGIEVVIIWKDQWIWAKQVAVNMGAENSLVTDGNSSTERLKVAQLYSRI